MITREFIKEFRSDFKKAVKELEEKHGVTIDLKNISFDNVSFRGPVEVKLKEVNGVSSEQVEFEKLCSLYGLAPSDYKKKITLPEGSFELIGFKTSSPKYCILLRRPDGRTVKGTRSLLETFKS